MNIPINKNIEGYKEEIWRGMGKRGFASFLLLCAGNIGGMAAAAFLAGANAAAALPFLFPFNAIVGVVGFFPADKVGQGFLAYVRSAWRANFSPTLLFQAAKAEGGGPPGEAGRKEKKRGKAAKKEKRQKPKARREGAELNEKKAI